MEEKYLIIDGNSILNRAFYGIMSKMTNKEGTPTNAVYGFINIYYMIIEKINPKYVTCTFDLKAPTFRHKMYTEYKAQRKPMPEDLKTQLPIIKEVLKAMNVHIVTKEGYEADDIIGTLAKQNEKKDIMTYILTGDKDSFQLISDKTNIIMPSSKQGKTEYNIINVEELYNKYKIAPCEVIEVKALMGDASDNIPGVPGIGEKTGYDLINKYHSIDYIYDNFDQIALKPKQRENMTNGKDSAYMSRTLATIDTNVPVEQDLKSAIVEEINYEETFKMFNKYNFKKFLAKYDFSNINVENEVTETIKKINLDCKVENVESLEKYLDSEFSYIIDETNNKLVIYKEKEDCIYISSLEKENIIAICESNQVKNGFRTKRLIKLYLKHKKALKEENKLQGKMYDLEIAYFTINTSKTNPEITDIAEELLGIEIEKDDTKKQISMFDLIEEENKLPETKIKEYKETLKLINETKEVILNKIKELGSMEVFEKIEMPLIEVLASMEVEGIKVNKEKLENFNKEITEKIEKLQENIYKLAEEEFNINSTQQLGKILFEKLEIPFVKKTKTGYSTDKEVLEKIEEEHEIIPYIIEYRTLTKLKSTYVEGLKPLIDETSRVHTTFMQTVTTTGRLSSVEPNMQNIPARTDLGKNIRGFFVAEEGKYILDADYSQIELRILAHIAKDENMINAFLNNIDVHKDTASKVFNVELEEVTEKQRSASKAVNFGIVYGISEFGLAKQINVTRKEAKEYIENYLEKYSGIRTYMHTSVEEAKLTGYSKTIFGRVRYIPELKATNKNIVQFGERVAMNSPIQGSAADIIKLAMINIYDIMKQKKLKSKMLLQVHDELLFEVPEEEIEIMKQLVEEEMENVISLEVPLIAEPGIGESWLEAK